jgi:hypothetical protein
MNPVQQPTGAGTGSGGIKRASVEATASGSTQVAAAVPGQKLRVVGAIVGPVSAAVATKFQSAATDITPAAQNAANGGWQCNFWPGYLCETAVGEALNVNLSANATVPVMVTYIEVD